MKTSSIHLKHGMLFVMYVLTMIHQWISFYITINVSFICTVCNITIDDDHHDDHDHIMMIIWS